MSALPATLHANAAAAPVADGGRDALLAALASYAVDATVDDPGACVAARACLLDAIACALRSLRHPDCVRILGPLVPGGTMIGGARVLGTSYELDPVQAAFNLGAMIRWCADAHAGAARECHPADALGAILAVADWRSRRAVALGEAPLKVRDVLAATIKAHGIHAALAAASSLHDDGRDDVLYVRVASAAVATALLGGTRDHALAAISHAFVDGAPLRPAASGGDAAARERWAVGDAASRGVRHALLALGGERACAIAASCRAAGELPGGAGRPAPVLDCGRLAAALSLAGSHSELELQQRLATAAAAHYSPRQATALAVLCADSAKLDDLAVHEFVSALVKN